MVISTRFSPITRTRNSLSTIFLSFMQSSRLFPLLAASTLAWFITTFSLAAAPDWENEAVFRINKEEPHTTKMPFPTANEALTKTRMESPWALSLNGDWNFHWTPTPAGHPTDFYIENFDDSAWKTIPVPSCVEIQGYGTPIYTNNTYPFKKDPPRVTGEPASDWTMFKERNSISAYRRTFEVPTDWQDRQTFIVFNGVASAFNLYLNGKKVGYSQDSRTPAEFNITPYLKPGKNLLAVEVFRHSDGSYLECQDMWRLSGIFRDVYMWSSAQIDLRDFEIHAKLEDDQTGSLSIKTWTRNLSAAAAEYQISAALIGAGGQTLASLGCSGEVSPKAETVADAKTAALKIRHWSAEEPNLYTLLLTLKDGKGSPIAFYSRKIGFVRSEIKDGNLLVNGRPILIKGVNRHDFNPTSGYYVPESVMHDELNAMKRLNINTIRTSHYPNDPRLLELIDEYGFYLISEANIESHGMGYKEDTLGNNPSWGPAHLDRVRNMVEMVKNHPSVVIWSLGNESGDGVNFENCAAWLHHRDPSRPLQYERAGMGSQFANPGMADYIDIITPMYFPISRLENWCREEEKKPLSKQRPLIQCEYNHTMGNSSGGFAEYWQIIRKERLMQGGCIWDWKDQGILQTQPAREKGTPAVSTRDGARFVAPDGSLRYFAYGGDFGDKPNDNNFCFNGIMQADLAPNPHSVEIAHQYRSILTTGVDLRASQPKVKVFNEHFFSTLRNQPLRWTLRENGRPLHQGEVVIQELAPQAAVEVIIPVPDVSPRAESEYHLDLEFPQTEDKPWEKAGFIVARDQLDLDWKSGVSVKSAAASTADFTIQDTADLLEISGPAASVVIDQRNGQVRSYKIGGREMLVRPLALNFWRPPTDNEIGAKLPVRCQPWREAGENAKVVKASHQRSLDNVRATYELAVPVGESQATIVYELRADGALRTSLSLRPLGKQLPPIPAVSFSCALTPEYREWTWFGRGPEENYSDRNESTFVGIWNGSVDKLWWPYGRPQETANRTGVRWSSFTNASGKGVRVRTDDEQKLEIAAWPFLSSDLETSKHPADIPSRDLISLRIAHRVVGLGGENSWGLLPRPAHMLESNHTYQFAFVIESATNR
jgi:beta-galactosidase